jgi:hypothetical protein
MKNIHRPLAALAALALAALIPACGGKKEGVAGAYTYLPANSTVVGIIQVKKLFGSELAQMPEIKAQLEQAKQKDDFKKMLDAGLDPTTNVDTVLVAFINVEAKDGAVIVTGSFDAEKVAKAMIENQKEPKPDEGVEVLAPGVLAVGKKTAIASAKEQKGLDGSPAVKEVVSLADDTRTLYIVGKVPAEATKDMPANMPPQLKSISAAALSLSVTQDLTVSLLARLGSDSDAMAIKGLLDSMLPTMIPPTMADVLKALKITTKGTDLSVDLTMTNQQIKEQLAKAK